MHKSVPVDLKHVLQELAARRLVEVVDGEAKLFAPTFRTFVEEESGGRLRPFIRRLLSRQR